MEGVLFLVLGLVFGSFLNALLWRLSVGKEIAISRSQCIKCGHVLGWRDLVPLASFLWLGGKCRYCKEKISWQYFWVELACGTVFFLISGAGLGVWEKAWLAGMFLVGFSIFVYDLRHLIISDVFIVSGLLLVLIKILVEDGVGLVNGLLTGLGVSFFFLTLYLVSNGKWIGGGDVKLGFLIGLWLGWPFGVVGVLIAYITGAVVGVGLIVFKKAGLGSRVPFGPFLVIGSAVAYLYGANIMEWYLGLL